MKSDPADVPFYQRRGTAVWLVGLSGAIIVCLSLVLQVLAWELRPFLFARFGWSDPELPQLTAAFLGLFGYRPDGYLTLVTWWFWWPMVAALWCCHIRYREPREFASAFSVAFVSCWLIFGCYVAGILVICSMPFIILLDEMHTPPAWAAVIVPLSWLMPLALLLAILIVEWRSWLGRRSADGASPPSQGKA